MSYEVTYVPDDGLDCPDIGGWAIDKYRMVGLYASLFSTGMKAKWEKRVYIDLYAGSGHGRLQSSGKIVLGSPLIALTVRDPFDKYIFCEENQEKLKALEVRARKIAPNRDIVFIRGDCNSKVDDLLREIPTGSPGHGVLSLCFVDPYNLVGVRFGTLKRLASRYMDFLCLLALHMDANRNYARYLEEEASQVDEFLGLSSWRNKWHEAKWDGLKFPEFLAQEFSERMATLDYLQEYAMKEVRSDEKNLPLYRLALFSRSKLAFQYWDQVLKFSTDTGWLF